MFCVQSVCNFIFYQNCTQKSVHLPNTQKNISYLKGLPNVHFLSLQIQREQNLNKKMYPYYHLTEHRSTLNITQTIISPVHKSAYRFE